MYFTNPSVCVRHGQLSGSIGVLESRDKPIPIGMASSVDGPIRGAWPLCGGERP